jgi:broad specificity phosphatase PhoE
MEKKTKKSGMNSSKPDVTKEISEQTREVMNLKAHDPAGSTRTAPALSTKTTSRSCWRTRKRAAAANLKAHWTGKTFRCSANAFADGTKQKLIHWQRHGQGTHNLAAEKHGREVYKDEALADARLTTLGREQAKAQQGTTTAFEEVELVICSPLSRATETALISWAHLVDKRVPFLAVEHCREQIGLNLCDRRRSISELRGDYPTVDYGFLESEDDVLWTLERETKLTMAHRGEKMLDWLQSRPEDTVAVVCHSAFLLALCNVVLEPLPGEEVLSNWFETGEIRTMYVSFD